MTEPTFADGDLDRFATIPEAAARMRLSTRTVYRMIANGEVPVTTIAGKKRVPLRRLFEAFPVDGERAAS